MAKSGLSFFTSEPAEEHPQGATAEEHSLGVPAELLPYLIEADDDGPGTEGARTHLVEEIDEDEERVGVLRALMEHSLLAGPDPSVLSEVLGETGEWEELDDGEWEETLSKPTDSRANNDLRQHSDDLDAAQSAVELQERVEEIYQSIIARAPEHKIHPSLERVQGVLDILGDPQHSYPTVHITGTNGKTSTARMTDALLSALGMRVGRFTSPHLMDVRERISLEGEPISAEGFVAAWEDIAPYVDMIDEKSTSAGGPVLSFFEVFTVMAYAAFADYPVDAAVIEVGVGGQWDATNVINADVAVITPIDLDHMTWLGSTVEDIAREKAGIIKPGQIVVIARQAHPSVEEILLARTREVGAVARVEGRDFEVVDSSIAVGGQMVTVRTPAATYTDVFLPLHGRHQAHNAACALVAAEAVMGGRALDGRIVEDGMMKVTSPGRMEIVRRSPTVIVDAAHNPHGARSLVKALEESFDFTRLVGVFSAMGDKDVEQVLVELEPHFDELVVTAMPGERALGLDALFEVAVDVFGEDRVHSVEGVDEAIVTAVHRAEATGDPATSAGVIVCGSVVLAGLARRVLRHS